MKNFTGTKNTDGKFYKELKSRILFCNIKTKNKFLIFIETINLINHNTYTTYRVVVLGVMSIIG